MLDSQRYLGIGEKQWGRCPRFSYLKRVEFCQFPSQSLLNTDTFIEKARENHLCSYKGCYGTVVNREFKGNLKLCRARNIPIKSTCTVS